VANTGSLPHCDLWGKSFRVMREIFYQNNQRGQETFGYRACATVGEKGFKEERGNIE